ncbi:MAG TPA: hypothetical protein VNG33_24470 [Polyangiaceae bacterium]|nr:hypothetical protein [Polyangiaceae bacterium]
MNGREEPLGPVRAAIAALGSAFIYLLIRVFGRVVTRTQAPWLWGPFGGEYIGDTPYEECAEREGLLLTRHAATGGLIPNFAALDGDGFRAEQVNSAVRDFYEHTAEFRMDVWTESAFPASIGLWLLVTTISRKVNQLNFPLRALDTARGMDSEIVLLREPEGAVRYAGWYRRLSESGRVIYTGFYMLERAPGCPRPCVKVVFPMPEGNATVLLRPGVDAQGNFSLSSEGSSFGDAGFYRVQRGNDDKVRVWRITSLKEFFEVYVDDSGTLRCDHAVRFCGLPVLRLHYRIERKSARAGGEPLAE